VPPVSLLTAGNRALSAVAVRTALVRAPVDATVTLDRLPTLEPKAGEVHQEELAVSDDALVKVFALGPGGRIEPHEHADATNVFHVLEGAVTILQDDSEQRIEAPGVVYNERGQVHGAHNDSEDRAVLTATLCPLPG
jgi:quercetin dioxygenase-like cupin family protein